MAIRLPTFKKAGLSSLSPENQPLHGISAHIDTLGAMVRSINANGTLRLTPIGGYMMEAIEGTYCKIHTRANKIYTGTILTTMPSVHTYDDARSQERVPKNMEVRIDEVVKTKENLDSWEFASEIS